ncbi:MAG: Ig-like domain-containing protein [bacterium]|nr:Ig-like domain-containing protein [bacterium]
MSTSDYNAWRESNENGVPLSAVIGKTGLCYYKGYGYGGNYQPYIDAIDRTVDPDNSPPYVFYRNPNDGASGVGVNTDVKARLSDDGYGIDVDSVTIDVEYPGSGGPIDGNQTEEGGSTFLQYLGLFDPDDPLPYDTEITVRVNAEDLDNNTMTEEVWTFTTGSEASIETVSLGELKATFK